MFDKKFWDELWLTVAAHTLIMGGIAAAILGVYTKLGGWVS